MFSGTTIAEVTPARPGLGWLTGWLWIPAVAVRLIAALILVFGPWTDQQDELVGWDVERFQEIADRAEPAWSQIPVEYPPGSVVVFDAIAGDTVVATGRTLVLLAAAAELTTVLALWRRVGPGAAKAFLILGAPLVPMGLVRLDLLAIAFATTAAVVLLGPPNGDLQPVRNRERARRPLLPTTGATGVGFGLLVAAGAMVKIWPALVVAGAVTLRRWSKVASAVGFLALSGVVWLFVVGDGLGPVDQVLSLRGATGWHVESVPGTIIALITDDQARLELNAYRIGTLNQAVVTIGRAAAVVCILLLAYVGAGFGSGGTPAATDDTPMTAAGRERLALVLLGSVAALIATAPLLSPQFLLWLTPWAAMLVATGDNRDRAVTRLVTLVFVVTVLTGGTLLVFGPPNLADTTPALLLTIRNACLLAVPVLCLRRLWQTVGAQAKV